MLALIFVLAKFVAVDGDARKKGAAEALAQRAMALKNAGDMELFRGYLSLALHIDPFMPYAKLTWIEPLIKKEFRQPWRGNLFVGLDKTHIENIVAQDALYIEERVADKAIYAWRNLELVGESCCGMDNVAVFFQQAGHHMSIMPFMNLAPHYRVKEQNNKMIESFNEWWTSNGRRPMPEPAITYDGNGKFDWEIMKIVFRKNRVPVGWNDLIQAVLLARMNYIKESRVCAQMAIQANKKLKKVIDELLPEGTGKLVVQPTSPHALDEKFVICYNPHVGLGNLAVVMVSAHLLAKVTGRTFILHWNVNLASSHAFKLRAQPGVKLLADAVTDVGVAPAKVKSIYFFHMMHSPDLGDNLELLGCSDLNQSLSKHRVVTVSSNLFFAPIMAVNPHYPGLQANFPELLRDLLQPSDRAVERAVSFAKETAFGKATPVVAIHIRAREEGEDNDDWPTAQAPDKSLLKQLRECTLRAIAYELGDATEWDLFIATTTEKARIAVTNTFEGHAKGLRRVLTLPQLNRIRRAEGGAVDAMAEALLISRADVFMRLVVGTSGFSTFAYLSNALRAQNEWAISVPGLERSNAMPNYLVTDKCGAERCYSATSELRMASISWHGPRFVHRSCGDVVSKAERNEVGVRAGCSGLEPFRETAKKHVPDKIEKKTSSTKPPSSTKTSTSSPRPSSSGKAGRLFSYGDLFSWLYGKIFGKKDEL